MKKFLTISFALILLIYGCAPIPVYRLQSLDQNKDIYMGVESIKKSDTNAIVVLQFEKQSGKDFEFYISIQNESPANIYLNPKDIYLEALEWESNNNRNRIYAYDPEKQIEKIDKKLILTHEFYDTMYSLQIEKNFWENEALRTTDIHPNEKIGGVIRIPIFYKAQKLKIVIPVNNIEYEFIYKQTRS